MIFWPDLGKCLRLHKSTSLSIGFVEINRNNIAPSAILVGGFPFHKEMPRQREFPRRSPEDKHFICLQFDFDIQCRVRAKAIPGWQTDELLPAICDAFLRTFMASATPKLNMRAPLKSCRLVAFRRRQAATPAPKCVFVTKQKEMIFLGRAFLL